MNWGLFKNSLIVSAEATVAATVIGLSIALFALGLSRSVRSFIFGASIVAVVLPPFLVTNCWLDLLGNAGVWRPTVPFNILTLPGTVFVLTMLYWPVPFFLIAAALRRIDTCHIEVEPSLHGLSALRWLLLPTAKAAVIQAAFLTFVLCLNNFAVPVILQTKVLPEEVWVNFTTSYDYTSAWRNGWVFIAVPLLIVAIARPDNLFELHRGKTLSFSQFRQCVGLPIYIFAAAITAITIFLSVGMPLGQLTLAKNTWPDFFPAIAAGKSAIVYSIAFATISASILLLISISTAHLPLRWGTWISFLVPGVILGIATIWIFNRPPLTALYRSVAIVVVMFVLRYFAPGWNIVSASIRATDRGLRDVYILEGANRWELFRFVQLPQILPQLCVAWYVTYLFCLWDVETLILIVPPGVETVALRIFNLLHFGHNSQVNALCVTLLLLAVLPLVLWQFVGRIVGKKFPIPTLICGFAICFVLSGCSPAKANKTTNQFPVTSKVFSEVQIIGSQGTAPGQFNKPRSLAVDTNDNLFVVDMTGRVQKFSSQGVYLMSWQMPQTDLGKPKGMARDTNGNILVVEPHYQRVNHYASDGTLVFQWGKKGDKAGEFVLPRSIAVNSQGDIYVSEYTTVDRIQAFSALGKQWKLLFGQTGSGNGEFNRPEGLGIDAADRVYVADSCNHRIQIFSPEGKFMKSFGSAGSARGEMSYPYDVRIDASGLQFVCEFGNSRIQIFDAAQNVVEVLGAAGGSPGQFSNPWSIALDSKGNLYVADSLNHRVQKFVRRSEKKVARVDAAVAAN